MEPQNKSRKENRKRLDWLMCQEIKTKMEVMQHHLSLCQIMINELFEEEVVSKSGERYSRADHDYYRWGYNKGSVRIGDSRLKVEVPRIKNKKDNTFSSLESYSKYRDLPGVSDQLMEGVLLGLSTRNYDRVIDNLGEGFGLSKSSVSKKFKSRTKEKLKEFENRKLDDYDFVALFLDGKYLVKDQIIIALGVTAQGNKIPLGFIQAPTENSMAIEGLLNNLIDRGFDYSEGLLVLTDGSKGMKKAINTVFGKKMKHQRCIWHKRENVLSYLPEDKKPEIKRKYDNALAETTLKEAEAKLDSLHDELYQINISAAKSLMEGREELLTLHRLELNVGFWKSFSSTNCIESLNSQLGRHLRKVKSWKNSEHKHRWIAASLLEIENKMKKVSNYKDLHKMKNKLKFETTSPQISTEKRA